MAITIRHGKRYLARQVFSGASFAVSRYEQEHDPAQWMFVIDDHASDRAMEFDEADADMLAGELRQVDAGDLLPFEFESRLKGYFDEAERGGDGQSSRMGTYTPPPPYRVFRVIGGGVKRPEPSAFSEEGAMIQTDEDLAKLPERDPTTRSEAEREYERKVRERMLAEAEREPPPTTPEEIADLDALAKNMKL